MKTTTITIQSEDDEINELLKRFVKEGLSPNLPPKEKLVHVWRWLVDAESNLRSSRNMLDKSRLQHDKDMKEVEIFVAQLKDLTDERVAKVQLEKHQLKAELQRIKASLPENMIKEISQMLNQEGLTEISTSPISEQVAYLLVERSRLLEELATEKEKYKSMSDNLTDNLKLSSAQLKNSTKKENTLLVTKDLNEDGEEQSDRSRPNEDDTDSSNKQTESLNTDSVNSDKEAILKRSWELEIKNAELLHRSRVMEKTIRQLENENETLVFKLSEALKECDENEALLRKFQVKSIVGKCKEKLLSGVILSKKEISTLTSPKHQTNKSTTTEQDITESEKLQKLQSEIKYLKEQIKKAELREERFANQFKQQLDQENEQAKKLKMLSKDYSCLKDKLKATELEMSRLQSALNNEKMLKELITKDFQNIIEKKNQLTVQFIEYEEIVNSKLREHKLLCDRIQRLEEENSRLVQETAKLEVTFLNLQRQFTGQKENRSKPTTNFIDKNNIQRCRDSRRHAEQKSRTFQRTFDAFQEEVKNQLNPDRDQNFSLTFQPEISVQQSDSCDSVNHRRVSDSELLHSHNSSKNSLSSENYFESSDGSKWIQLDLPSGSKLSNDLAVKMEKLLNNISYLKDVALCHPQNGYPQRRTRVGRHSVG